MTRLGPAARAAAGKAQSLQRAANERNNISRLLITQCRNWSNPCVRAKLPLNGGVAGLATGRKKNLARGVSLYKHVTLVVDPTIRLPAFDLHRRQWSLLNRFRTGQGHCNACHKQWGFNYNELCDCGETQTMSHIVNSCPLTKFDGSLLRFHEADEAAIDWLTTYGS